MPEIKLQLPPTIAANIEQFTGRTWLLPILLEWLNGTSSRWFILTAVPGAGKGMIMAWLAGAGPIPNDPVSCSQLEQLRSLVKAVHFCKANTGSISPRALAKNMAEQLAYTVPEFATALTATLNDVVRIAVDQQTGTVESGAIVTGVHIGTLDLGGLGDELSFNRLLREPLQLLYKGGFHDTVLLLVNALDEANTYTGNIGIVPLLSNLDDLPTQVRILMSTRADPRVYKYFPESFSLDLCIDAPINDEDVRSYMYQRLDKLDEKSRTLIANRVAEAAAGNFLYAQLVLDDLLRRPSVIKIPDTLSLPESLSEIYHSFLTERLGADEKLWYAVYRPLLGLLAVAQGDGLHRRNLASIIGQEVDYELRVCKPYLQGNLPDGPFRLFHKSFGDYLLYNGDIDYHIDHDMMHRQIARYYLQSYDDNWSACDDYGMRYLPIHMIRGGQGQALCRLLLNYGWLKAKMNVTDIASVIADYELLPEKFELHLMRDALEKSAPILVHDKTQLAGQLIGQLQSCEEPEIRSLIEQIRSYRALP